MDSTEEILTGNTHHIFSDFRLFYRRLNNLIGAL